MSPRSVRRTVAVLALLTAARLDAGAIVDVTATDGVQLVAELDGASGPGVVLADGGGPSRRVFAAAARVLADAGFRALRVDLRGHGASEGVADAAAVGRDVEGAYRYLLGRKIRPVFLVGAGAAGTAALAVAARVQVAGVILLSAPPGDASMAGTLPVLRLGAEPAALTANDATVARMLAFLRAPTVPGARDP